MDQAERLLGVRFQLNARTFPRVTRLLSTTNTISSSTILSVDPTSQETLMKQHLIFLLHASKCNTRDKLRISQGQSLTQVSEQKGETQIFSNEKH